MLDFDAGSRDWLHDICALLYHSRFPLCHSRVGGNLLDPRFHEDDHAEFRVSEGVSRLVA